VILANTGHPVTVREVPVLVLADHARPVITIQIISIAVITRVLPLQNLPARLAMPENTSQTWNKLLLPVAKLVPMGNGHCREVQLVINVSPEKVKSGEFVQIALLASIKIKKQKPNVKSARLAKLHKTIKMTVPAKPPRVIVAIATPVIL
jgi:hypothetical protein